MLAATRRRINLRGRLEDYSNLKLVKINVYVYILSVETVSIIQDSVLLLERDASGAVCQHLLTAGS